MPLVVPGEGRAAELSSRFGRVTSASDMMNVEVSSCGEREQAAEEGEEEEAEDEGNSW